MKIKQTSQKKEVGFDDFTSLQSIEDYPCSDSIRKISLSD